MDIDRASASVIGAAVAGVVIVGGIYLLKYKRASHRGSQRQTPLKLYHSFPFRSSRCAWLINELGIEDLVDIIPVSLHGPEARDLPKYKKEVHPHGTIPALQLDDGNILLESSAICLYLTSMYSDRDGYSKLCPDDDRIADYYDKIAYATSTFDQVLEPLYMQLTHTPEDERDQKLVDAKLEQFKIIASVLSKHFENNKYVCGDMFTTADCVLGYNIWWASVIKKGEFLVGYPILVSYLERLKKRSAFEMSFVGKRPIKSSGGSL